MKCPRCDAPTLILLPIGVCSACEGAYIKELLDARVEERRQKELKQKRDKYRRERPAHRREAVTAEKLDEFMVKRNS